MKTILVLPLLYQLTWGMSFYGDHQQCMYLFAVGGLFGCMDENNVDRGEALAAPLGVASQICSKKEAIETCFADRAPMCSKLPEVTEAINSFFKMCDGNKVQAPLKLYYEKLYGNLPETCGHETREFAEGMTCMLDDDFQEELNAIRKSNFKDSVAILRGLYEKMNKCFKAFFSMAVIPDCNGTSGKEVYLAQVSILNLLGVPGLDYYDMFLNSLEADLLQSVDSLVSQQVSVNARSREAILPKALDAFLPW